MLLELIIKLMIFVVFVLMLWQKMLKVGVKWYQDVVCFGVNVGICNEELKIKLNKFIYLKKKKEFLYYFNFMF